MYNKVATPNGAIHASVNEERIRQCNACGASRDLYEGKQQDLINVEIERCGLRLVFCPACLTSLALTIYPFRR